MQFSWKFTANKILKKEIYFDCSSITTNVGVINNCDYICGVHLMERSWKDSISKNLKQKRNLKNISSKARCFTAKRELIFHDTNSGRRCLS